MNALFLTQAAGLKMFFGLMKALQSPLQLERVGFYVADRSYFRQFSQSVPEIESGAYDLLKEWEIVGNAQNGEPDIELIRRYELSLGNPNLWGSLVADRNIYLGKKSSFFQDYRPRFSHTQMLNILQNALVRMERLFDEVRPDFVASWICVTLGEYLAYLFARSRGVPVLNLRPTRIGNYVTYGETIFEPSARVRAAYERYCRDGVDEAWVDQARRYVSDVQSGDARYEGAPASVPGKPSRSTGVARLPGAIFRTVRSEYRYRFGALKDNHAPGVVAPVLFRRYLRPMRNRWHHLRLSSGYVTEEQLRHLDYVFFPLHKEPENTMLVFSRPYLNQIEVIRNIGQSIPVGMTLVVKEHPVSVGGRPLSYYRKLLAIPNVRLADPGLAAPLLITNAKLVASIAGSLGWESILRRKPVVIFGQTPYGFLPDTMVRCVADLHQLGEVIADLMEGYEYQDEAVAAYVAATMSESAPVNLYSTLLGRDVHVPDQESADAPEAWQENIDRLARYTIGSLQS